MESLNPGEKWECFRSILNKGIKQCIPMANKYRRAIIKPGQLNRNVSSLIKEKSMAFKKYKGNGSPSEFQHYKECNKKCKIVIRVAKKD